MTYDEALKAGRKIGVSRATDAQALAMFCNTSLQLLCGAVSPEMVWNGAMAKGLTFTDVTRLAHDDPQAVEELMWA